MEISVCLPPESIRLARILLPPGPRSPLDSRSRSEQPQLLLHGCRRGCFVGGGGYETQDDGGHCYDSGWTGNLLGRTATLKIEAVVVVFKVETLRKLGFTGFHI